MDTARYEAAVERNLAEVQRALLDLELMDGMEAAGDLEGNAAIGVYYALFNDYIAHCIKVLEKRSDVASFWYVYRTNQGPLDRAARELKVEIAALDQMSEKLKRIRDKTHFHIDREDVLDPNAVWQHADINGKELANTVNRVWALLNAARALMGKEPLHRPAVSRRNITRATQVLEGRE